MMTTHATGRHVLVVDDVKANCLLAAAFMRKLGWQTAEVDGGKAALAWLDNNPSTDLVLLDISMPDLSGEDVCRRLRANPSFAALKIVAYTAHAMPSDVSRFLANGFDAILVKPISMEDLKDVVNKLFPQCLTSLT